MTKLRTGDLLQALRAAPRAGSAELCARLGGINRATLARALKTLGDAVVSGGGSRRIRYALRRELRGNARPIPLYRIDEAGRGHELGHLSLIYPEGSWLEAPAGFPWPLDKDMADGWFDGLPYPLLDMRPQGFLGRHFAHAHALDLGVSGNPEEWTDDDVVHVLATAGYDQPGDLVLGETAYRRFLAAQDRGSERFLGEDQIEAAYPRLAEAAMGQGDPGSSAGGEFPKFTASRWLGTRKIDVIVKFSGADDSPAVRRWADLLVCEHLAGQTLNDMLQIPAAESAIYQFAGRTFLEVARFDRHGDFGRSAVCTLGSLNAALLGARGTSWHAVAQRLEQAGWLSGQDTARIALLWWFGKLIGNTDMHEGNLAFRPGLALAPAYDMLPMAYAPLRGGEVVDRVFAPALPLPGEAPAWRRAAEAAERYWSLCAEEPRISPAFRRVCADNSRIVSGLLSRLFAGR